MNSLLILVAALCLLLGCIVIATILIIKRRSAGTDKSDDKFRTQLLQLASEIKTDISESNLNALSQVTQQLAMAAGQKVDAATSAAEAAFDQKKNLIEWVDWNWEILVDHDLICTGTTGTMLEELLSRKIAGLKHKKLKLKKLKSGPLGGDQQLGAMIAEGKIDLVIFLWDPMMPQPHEVDVKALLRITVLYNIPTACNRSSADYMISSSLMNSDYKPAPNDFSGYLGRKIVV